MQLLYASHVVRPVSPTGQIWLTQENSLSIVHYGLSLYVTEEKILVDYPVFPQLWYADDFGISGAGPNIKSFIICI